MLHVDTVGKVTNPVTQVADVAVKRASTYETLFPLLQLMGRYSKTLPIKIVIKKLNIIIWVVESVTLFLLCMIKCSPPI